MFTTLEYLVTQRSISQAAQESARASRTARASRREMEQQPLAREDSFAWDQKKKLLTHPIFSNQLLELEHDASARWHGSVAPCGEGCFCSVYSGLELRWCGQRQLRHHVLGRLSHMREEMSALVRGKAATTRCQVRTYRVDDVHPLAGF